jgi:hypothetical protein
MCKLKLLNWRYCITNKSGKKFSKALTYYVVLSSLRGRAFHHSLALSLNRLGETQSRPEPLEIFNVVVLEAARSLTRVAAPPGLKNTFSG